MQCNYPSHFTGFIDTEKFSIFYYNSPDKALEDVEKHKIWTIIYINNKNNFVEAHFQKLATDWLYLDEGIIRSTRMNFF